MLFVLRSELQYTLLFVFGIGIDNLLRLVLNTVGYVLVVHSLRREGVQTRITNECCMLSIDSMMQ